MKIAFEKVETCAACGYRHATGTAPFILSSLLVEYEKPGTQTEAHTAVYICPTCGTLQVPQPAILKDN
jgi:rubrerythrin